MENQIIVYVDWAERNFTAFTDAVNGTTAVTHKDYGKLIEAFREAFALHLEGAIEDKEVPAGTTIEDFTFEYHHSIVALLQRYSNVITRSGLAKLSGINETQLGHYAVGIKSPRPQQEEKIRNAIHALGRELQLAM